MWYLLRTGSFGGILSMRIIAKTWVEMTPGWDIIQPIGSILLKNIVWLDDLPHSIKRTFSTWGSPKHRSSGLGAMPRCEVLDLVVEWKWAALGSGIARDDAVQNLACSRDKTTTKSVNRIVARSMKPGSIRIQMDLQTMPNWFCDAIHPNPGRSRLSRAMILDYYFVL